jgi:hypothetical protein
MPLAYAKPLPLGTRVYIIGHHPWSDCAGVIVAYVWHEELERYGALLHLDNEQIEVMVWSRQQLREIPGGL